jgi:pimeloyl-ACP methyl ester carboxylesterase
VAVAIAASAASASRASSAHARGLGRAGHRLGKELTYGTEAYVPNLVLRYLPHASHWVQQDAPDDVNAILREWLGSPTR